MPAVVSRVLPGYPTGMSAVPVRGTIEMEVVVDRTGAVAQARMVRSLADRSTLDQSALDAVKQWRFTPGMDRGNRPVAVLVLVNITFEPPATGQAGTVSASVSQLPRFVSATPDPFASATSAVSKPGMQAPTMLRSVSPSYTSAAMRVQIQGAVELEVVVMPDGTVGAVRVLKSLDDKYGLDEQAVAAAGRWFFEPGKMNGRPVATIVTLILEFRLH
jgi:TonB family protein